MRQKQKNNDTFFSVVAVNSPRRGKCFAKHFRQRKRLAQESVSPESASQNIFTGATALCETIIKGAVFRKGWLPCLLCDLLVQVNVGVRGCGNGNRGGGGGWNVSPLNIAAATAPVAYAYLPALIGITFSGSQILKFGGAVHYE